MPTGGSPWGLCVARVAFLGSDVQSNCKSVHLQGWFGEARSPHATLLQPRHLHSTPQLRGLLWPLHLSHGARELQEGSLGAWALGTQRTGGLTPAAFPGRPPPSLLPCVAGVCVQRPFRTQRPALEDPRMMSLSGSVGPRSTASRGESWSVGHHGIDCPNSDTQGEDLSVMT